MDTPHTSTSSKLLPQLTQAPPQYSALDDSNGFADSSSNLLASNTSELASKHPKYALNSTASDDLESGFQDSLPDGQPPEFSMYRASYSTDSLGNITSHDPHLNSDGEALCRFILLHSTTPPELFVKLTGTHEEVRIETFTETEDGRTVYKTRERRDTVTDFSFTVPLVSQSDLESAVRVIHVVNDGEVVSRGACWRQRADWKGKDLLLFNRAAGGTRWCDSSAGSRAVGVSWKERRAADQVSKEIKMRGLPPFIPPWMFPDGTFSRAPPRPPPEFTGPDVESSCQRVIDTFIHQNHYHHNPHPQDQIVMEQELRKWCDIYCQSTKRLKQFRVEKRCFGWNLEAIRRELYSTIRALPNLRSTHITCDFHSTSSSITIRPVNIFSKVFSLSWFPKFLLSITLIYPILWLIRYFILGAELGVIRIGYPMVYWSGERSNGMDQEQMLVLKGQKDSEWLQANLQSIKFACLSGKIGSLLAG
ncbi:uncharacterized protein MELLADRAFT_76448 [Melampsora larici-populina 98AG31]|uniref:Uncharacterized protein n=1 Tax=Melampsora larici-populina (strain 98AG31 / pathotype 3-4-7) TaxID=747676 RepID=F4R6F0_MELLP|nr:uncharacterized protein MELLADRAFT_76448 [Melampsora larici-populina 98AG31]EGG11866.1 hypothetical protein MELLADRAFT_76448 [Melampsora larici-populina 98AG31]